MHTFDMIEYFIWFHMLTPALHLRHISFSVISFIFHPLGRLLGDNMLGMRAPMYEREDNGVRHSHSMHSSQRGREQVRPFRTCGGLMSDQDGEEENIYIERWSF